MFASRIGLSDDRTNRNDEADNDTDGVPDLISSESDDDNGDLDMLLPAILSTNLNDEADNDIDGVPDSVLPAILSTNKKDEADNDTGSVLNRFVEGHTHESIDQQFKKLQSLSSMQEMD